jgi:uncharacterized protein (DUF4415 family)
MKDNKEYSDTIADDPDNPELTPEILSRMRPMREVFPEFVAEIKKMRARGRPKAAAPKIQVTLRLDADVVGAFKADGPGWQSRINGALRKVVERR